MMKKVLSLMLVVLLCLTFTACGDDDKVANTTITPADGVVSETFSSGIPSGLPTDAVTPSESQSATATTAPQVVADSIVGSWRNADGVLLTFNADGTLTVTENGQGVTMTWSASFNQLTLTYNGKSSTGTYTVSGNALTLVNEEGESQTMVKVDASAQTTTTAPAVNNNASAAAQAVAAFVAENQAELLAQFEAAFTDAANGITCSSTIKAEGTGFVIDVKISALNNVTDAQIQQMKQTYASIQSTFDQSLAMMQSGLPELTYFTINVCDGYGNVLLTIRAGN